MICADKKPLNWTNFFPNSKIKSEQGELGSEDPFFPFLSNIYIGWPKISCFNYFSRIKRTQSLLRDGFQSFKLGVHEMLKEFQA